MNKKFSTLVAALILGSSLFCGTMSANVVGATNEAANTVLKDGTKYYFGEAATAAAKYVQIAVAQASDDPTYKVLTIGAPTSTPADATLLEIDETTVAGKVYLKLKATVGGVSGVVYVKSDGSPIVAGTKANMELAMKTAISEFELDATEYNAAGLTIKTAGLNFIDLDGATGVATSADQIFFLRPSDDDMAAADLNKMYDKGFSLKFPTMSPAISANPFTSASLIQAVKVTNAVAGTYLSVGGTFTAAEVAAGLALNTKANIDKFKAATFIVMDTIPLTTGNSSDFNGVKGAGYQFKTVKGADLIKTAADGNSVTAAFNKRWAANAQFAISNNANDTDSLIIEVVNPYLPKKVKIGDEQPFGEKVRVSVVNFNNQNIVTTYCQAEGIMPDVVDGKVKWTRITLGSTNVVAQKDLIGIVNITSLNYLTNGKVFGPSKAILTNADAVAAKLVQFAKPEGQFLVTSDKDGAFTFTNRESGVTYGPTSNLRKVSDNVYTQANGDTLKIVAATTGGKYNGFKNYSKKLELDKTIYNLAVYSAVTDNVYLTEKHSADHLVGLSTDVANAAKWKLVKFESDEVIGDGAHKNDSIIISRKLSSLKDGKYNDDKKDSLVIFTYAIYNEANGEFLSYNEETKAFYCNPAIKTLNNARKEGVARFAIKEKADGTYNMVVVNDGTDELLDYSIFAPTSIYDKTKLYGAFSEDKVNQNTIADGLYDLTDNDLFVIEPVAAPQYRSVSFLDTVSIYKNDNNKIRLYERNNFLGMQHIADVEKMAPAMVVDTAYVRGNTNKPQYLLLVRPEYVYHKDGCVVPGHPASATTAIDTVKGSFLVNMVDSAAAWGNKHSNPYIWDNCSKLAFVKGFHTKDTLFIERANNVVGDSIWVGENNENKIGKYAFRYVDRETKSFVIETSFDGTDKVGYIKWLNGTPVVVAELAQAEVFNMNEDETSKPTDNEAINATEVSVVAGAGSVTINNAAGKAVVITNLLGQTIVNTVITSDNATFTVPAGIVVVAVAGEEAVKTIVK